MITTHQFRVQRIQASAFTQSGEDIRPTEALKYVLNHWLEIYDAAPISMPFSEGPEELPLVILSSEDGKLRLEINRARMNMMWLRSNDDDVADVAGTFLEFGRRLYQLFSDQDVVIGRLAAVVIREAEVADPGKLLSRKYCKDEWIDGPLNRPEGFEIHAHKVFELTSDLRVNSWIRIKAAADTSGSYKIVRVEQDINGLSNERETRSFTMPEIQNFYSGSSYQLEHVMSQYFPESVER